MMRMSMAANLMGPEESRLTKVGVILLIGIDYFCYLYTYIKFIQEWEVIPC